MKNLNTTYGISKRIQLELLDENHLGIVKLIKSRIIKKDAVKIIEIAGLIRKTAPDIALSLLCNDNICSKSVALLKEHNIGIVLPELVTKQQKPGINK